MNQANSQSVRPTAGDVERRVIEIIAEQTNTDPAEIARETHFHDLGDSLDEVEAVMKLEEEFELSVPDQDVEKMLTVGELIDYVIARRDVREAATGGQAPPPPQPTEPGNS